MTGNVGGPLSPQEIETYRQEYTQGAQLFQQALQGYSQASEMHKKAAFKEVMDQAMQVMNQSARALKEKQLLSANQEIAKDYGAYQQDQSPATFQRLNNDLDQAQKSTP